MWENTAAYQGDCLGEEDLAASALTVSALVLMVQAMWVPSLSCTTNCMELQAALALASQDFESEALAWPPPSQLMSQLDWQELTRIRSR